MSWTHELFIIDNIKSVDFNVGECILIRTDSSIDRQISSQDIVEEKIAFKDIPYYYRTEKNPIEFNMKFSLLERKMTEDIMFKLNTIFLKSKYIPFQSCDYMGVMFYVISASVNIITYGSYKGWIEINMRTSAPYGFAIPKVITRDFSTLTIPETFIIYSKFNVMHSKYNQYLYFPKMSIDMKGNATSITLTNISYGGNVFGFTGLTVGESLFIDNDSEEIISSTGNPRINKMINNFEWFALTAGKNIITISSPALLQILVQYPIYV